jgi:hypothetical protein
MHRGMIRSCNHLLVIAGLALLAIPAVRANDTSALSGTYQVIHKAETGGQARIQVQIHLVNRGARDLHIQRMTFWDFSHPVKGGTQSCSVLVHPAKSADTTQEFILPRAEYELWKRGARPRLVLEIATPQGRPTTQVVHLERTAGRKGN